MQLNFPPPPTHGLYINLQLFLAGGKFFACLFVCLFVYSFLSFFLLGFAGDGGAPRLMFFLAKSHGSYMYLFGLDKERRTEAAECSRCLMN